MSATPLVIVGAGGFGREVLDVLRASQVRADEWTFAGFVADDEPDSSLLARIDAHWLGPVASYLASPSAPAYVIAVGKTETRRLLAKELDAAGLHPVTLVHPTATFGADVEIGPGSVVCSHVSVTTNVRIGNHVHVNLNSTIGHDVEIADFVSINPLVAISGDVTIGECSALGTHSAVLQGLKIGAGAFVGAGAVVVRDVEPEVTVVGVPAKPLH
jgi:sugar O-acyltransferase (sialic acid O-acetyltransferase NeuD family)